MTEHARIKEAIWYLEMWKGVPSNRKNVNDVHYQMVEVSITAIQEVIDMLMEVVGLNESVQNSGVKPQ